MNKIPHPIVDQATIDDFGALYEIARNTKLASFPHILYDEADILKAYNQYISCNGDATKIGVTTLKCVNHLKNLYDATYRSPPPESVAKIKKYRNTDIHKSCPMCGSFGRGQLDHVLPKAKHPEYSIFSLNLVPSCRCNNLRQDTYVGVTLGERVLHPYFDDILGDRLIKISFVAPYKSPSIRLNVNLPPNHPLYHAANFHLNEVVLKTAIKGHIDSLWEKILVNPGIVLPRLPKGIMTETELLSVVENEINRLDDLHESKNNWNSIFVDGLMDTHVIKFLLDIINARAV